MSKLLYVSSVFLIVLSIVNLVLSSMNFHGADDLDDKDRRDMVKMASKGLLGTNIIVTVFSFAIAYFAFKNKDEKKG